MRYPTIFSRRDRSPIAQKLVRWLTLAGKSALEAAAFEEARSQSQVGIVVS